MEQTIARKATIGNRSTRVKNGDSTRMAAPKKTSKATTRTRSIGKRRLVKTTAMTTRNAVSESTIEVDAIIPTGDAALEARLCLDSITSPEMGCEEQAIAVSTLQEKEIGDRQKEPEVTTDLADMEPSTAARRSTILHWLAGAWNWVRKTLGSHQSRKRLRVCETVSLGEKRFVAVIEIDGEQFLVGGASSSVATLARLEPSKQFSELLRRRWAQDPVQA